MEFMELEERENFREYVVSVYKKTPPYQKPEDRKNMVLESIHSISAPLS